jgi:AraC-like DNA-binding protein
MPPTEDRPDLLQPLLISTNGVEPRHRLDTWRTYFDRINAINPVGGPSSGFAAHNVIWRFGGFSLVRNTAPAVTVERTLRHIRRDGLDHWVLRFTRSGFWRHRSRDACFTGQPGVPLLYSMDDPYDGDRTEADWLSLYVSRDAFPALSAGFATLGPGILETPGAALLEDYMLFVERRLPAAAANQVPTLIEATRSMVAACLFTGLAPGSVTPRDAAGAQVERVRGIIRQHIASPTLGPSKICRLAGLSRSQLYRLFEPHGGVARHLQVLRLRAAHAALSDPRYGSTIAESGEQVGFFDASTFSRSFRREFGYTPGEVRTAGRGGLVPAAPGVAPPPDDLGFVGLLRRLGTR